MKVSPMIENYAHILKTENDHKFEELGGVLKTRKMNDYEEAWVRSFEELERSIRRGREDLAIQTLKDLTMSEHSKTLHTQIIRECADKERANPLNAAAKLKAQRKYKGYLGVKKSTLNPYDPLDMQRDNGSILCEDGEEIERGITISPEDGILEAIDQAKSKNRNLEKLIEDAKLSKEAKEDLAVRTQSFDYAAMLYVFHGRQYMSLNYILKTPNGKLWVQDQHERLCTLDLYLKRETNDSFATHCEVYFPAGTKQVWIHQAGKRSNIEGKAVLHV